MQMVRCPIVLCGIALIVVGCAAKEDESKDKESVCSKSAQPVELASGQGPAIGLALDADYAYWTTGMRVADAAPSGGKVLRVPLAGGAPETLVADEPLPTAIAVNSTNVYWLDEFERALMTAPIAGGEPTTLTRTGGAYSLSVDEHNAYWLDFDSITLTSAVMRVSLAGGEPVQLASAQQVTGGLAVDADNVYWSDLADSGATVVLMKVPIAGGAATPLFSAAGVSAGALALDSTNVYLASSTQEYGSGVLEVPLGGGTPTLLTADGADLRVAAEAGHVYWSFAKGEGYRSYDVLETSAPDAGDAAQLTSDVQYLKGIAAYGSKVCWIANPLDTPGTVTCVESCR